MLSIEFHGAILYLQKSIFIINTSTVLVPPTPKDISAAYFFLLNFVTIGIFTFHKKKPTTLYTNN